MPNVIDKTWIQPHNKDLWEIFLLKNFFKPDSVILDFGCNNANFLIDAKKHCPDFNEKNYVGVDVNKNFIEISEKKFPNYRFIHHDSHHHSFNNETEKNCLVSETLKNMKFDIIIAYSVFTHCSLAETKRTLNDLQTLLKPGGVILYSLLTSENMKGFLLFNRNKCKFKITRETYNELLNKNFKKTVYWVNWQHCVTDIADYSENCETFICFYKNIETACNLLDSKSLGYHSLGNTRLQSIFKKGLL